MPKNKSLQRILLNEKEHLIGYKVVTVDMKSLGLRRNPNIITYPFYEWFFLPKEHLKNGNDDWGGIWVCRSQGNAKKVADYMRDKYARKTRIFKACLGEILYSNSYRVKTDRILLFEDITDKLM
ncbi:hypothetical protein JW756_07115 [Candidatus Woesearchaeota archaeon]|nr:hypothetical protein [Candidatus Woesearchaeota archaeon]